MIPSQLGLWNTKLLRWGWGQSAALRHIIGECFPFERPTGSIAYNNNKMWSLTLFYLGLPVD